MSDLVRISLEGGGSILVERADDDAGGPAPAALGRNVISEASASLERSLESVRRASQAVLAELGKASPDEIEVEFGVTLNAEAGAVLAKAGTGCHLTVTLTWKRQDDAAP